MSGINELSMKFQNCFIKVSEKMISMKTEAIDLYKLYWTDVSPDTTFTAALSTDPVINDTDVALTKGEVINAYTFIDNYNKMIDNQVVATSDYFQTIENTLYGNDPRTAGVISVAIESFGYRAKLFCNNALETYKDCKCIYAGYFANELNLMINALSSGTIVFGAEYTASEALLAMNVVEQFINMIENSAVTQADYKSSLAKWERMHYQG